MICHIGLQSLITTFGVSRRYQLAEKFVVVALVVQAGARPKLRCFLR